MPALVGHIKCYSFDAKEELRNEGLESLLLFSLSSTPWSSSGASQKQRPSFDGLNGVLGLSGDTFDVEIGVCFPIIMPLIATGRSTSPSPSKKQRFRC